ncbi:MAG: hypothetical protein ACK47R_07740, partial [Planctomycetia bacterium]
MADQGNDLGVENLVVLKRQYSCLFFLAISEQFVSCLNSTSWKTPLVCIQTFVRIRFLLVIQGK